MLGSVRLPDSFLEELRARTNLATLVGRKARLSRSGRNWKACCPFHQEKTPSFYVYDDGYHCFGCGAHGDAIGFVMQAQGASFMEAVEALADEAGLEIPRPVAREEAVERGRLAIRDVLAAAGEFYREQLHSPGGAAALAYLRARGVTDETIRRFGVGWSGEGRGGLLRRLGGQTDAATLMEAGLLREGEDGQPGGEFFFNRVMFPIRDRRGHVLAFGGRTLGEGQPKYLNSPETPVFAKRRTLYGLDLAREAARRGEPVIAVEGYMDAIALHQAGFAGAVAPLGTALTVEQLAGLWEISPTPVLCFDGDAAGARAAARTIDVALPLLSAERTLRFARLPEGEDPDTLVRRQGRPGIAAVLAAARPFSAALYESRREMAGGATPEARARLRALLEAASAAIPDTALRREYRREWDERAFAARRRTKPPATPSRRRPEPAEAAARRGEILLAIAICHPATIGAVEEALGGLSLLPPWEGVRAALLAWAEHASVLDSEALANHFANLGFQPELQRLRAVLPASATAERAEACWWHFYGLFNAGELERQVAAAQNACVAAPTLAAFDRLAALTAELQAVRQGVRTVGESAADEADILDD